jgi:hypothetical protein
MDEQIEQYYQLKNEYETTYREKMKKARKTKKEIKMECKLCNKEGFMVFSRKDHILTAMCDKPDCPKLEIQLPLTHTFPEYLEKVNKKIDNHMISLTRDKLNVFYGLSEKSNTSSILERLQTEQAWKATLEKTFDETSKRYTIQREEEQMNIQLNRHIRDIQDLIQERKIKEATEVYIEGILPLRQSHDEIYNKELHWDDDTAFYSKMRQDKFISSSEFTE